MQPGRGLPIDLEDSQTGRSASLASPAPGQTRDGTLDGSSPTDGCNVTDIWTYNDPDLARESDLVGYDVLANDGSIGEVGEATYEAGTAHVVVETGFWIFGKKRLIPAGAITHIDHESREVHLDMTKDQVKEAPDWEEQRWDDEDYRSTHGDYYRDYRAAP